MKNLLLTSTLFAFSIASFAQKSKVTESKENIGGGNNNALVITIYETSSDVIEKNAKSLLKDYNAKVSSQDGGWFGDNAIIKKMGNNTVDIYAKWEKIKDGETKLIMAFDLGGDYISSSKHPNEFNIAKDIMQNFAFKTFTESMAALLKDELKTFDKLTDEEKRLEKENKNLNDDIESYKQKIEDYKLKIKQAQDAIEANKANQGKKKEEISLQQKELSSTKDRQKVLE